jgi:hypothetical protein
MGNEHKIWLINFKARDQLEDTIIEMMISQLILKKQGVKWMNSTGSG